MVFARRRIECVIAILAILVAPASADITPVITHRADAVGLHIPTLKAIIQQHPDLRAQVTFTDDAGKQISTHAIDFTDPASHHPIAFIKAPARTYHTVRITLAGEDKTIDLPVPAALPSRLSTDLEPVERRLSDSLALCEPGVLAPPSPLPSIHLPEWSAAPTLELPAAPRTVRMSDFRRLVRGDQNPPSVFHMTPVSRQTAHPGDPTKKSVYIAASSRLFDPATGVAASRLHYYIEIPIDPAWVAQPGDASAVVDPATIRAHIDMSTTGTGEGQERISGERLNGLTQGVNQALVGDDGNLYSAMSYRGPARFNVTTARFEAPPVDLWQWYYNHLNREGSPAVALHPGLRPRPDFDSLIYAHNGRIWVMFGRYFLSQRSSETQPNDVLMGAVISFPQGNWDNREKFAADIRIHAEAYPTAPHPLFADQPKPNEERYKIRVLSGMGDYLLLWSNSFEYLWRIDLDAAGATRRVIRIDHLEGKPVVWFNESAKWLIRDGKPVGAVLSVKRAGEDTAVDAYLPCDRDALATTIPTGDFQTYNSASDYTLKKHMGIARGGGYGESRFRKNYFTQGTPNAGIEGSITLQWNADEAIRQGAQRAGPALVDQMLSFSEGPGYLVAPVPGHPRQIIGVSDYPTYYLSLYDFEGTGDARRRILTYGASSSSLLTAGFGPYIHQWMRGDQGWSLWYGGYTGVARVRSTGDFTANPPAVRRILAGHMENAQPVDAAPTGPIKWMTDLQPGLKGKTLVTGYDQISRGGNPWSTGIRWSTISEAADPVWHSLARLSRAYTIRNIAARLRIAPDDGRTLDLFSAGRYTEAMGLALDEADKPSTTLPRLFLYEDRGDNVVDRFSLTLGGTTETSIAPIETAVSSNGLYAIVLSGDGILASLDINSMTFADAVRLPGRAAMDSSSRRSPALLPAPRGGHLLAVEQNPPTDVVWVHLDVNHAGRFTVVPLVKMTLDSTDALKGGIALAANADGSADLILGPPPPRGDAIITVIPALMP